MVFAAIEVAAGRKPSALDALRRAIELNPANKRRVPENRQFEALFADPEFKKSLDRDVTPEWTEHGPDHVQRLASHPRTQLWLSFASVVVVINLLFACIAMERVPSADEIQKWSALQPFVIQPSSITGVYQNIDTDSVVFHYSTRLTDPTAFWRELHNQARSSGWVHLDRRCRNEQQSRV